MDINEGDASVNSDPEINSADVDVAEFQNLNDSQPDNEKGTDIHSDPEINTAEVHEYRNRKDLQPDSFSLRAENESSFAPPIRCYYSFIDSDDEEQLYELTEDQLLAALKQQFDASGNHPTIRDAVTAGSSKQIYTSCNPPPICYAETAGSSKQVYSRCNPPYVQETETASGSQQFYTSGNRSSIYHAEAAGSSKQFYSGGQQRSIQVAETSRGGSPQNIYIDPNEQFYTLGKQPPRRIPETAVGCSQLNLEQYYMGDNQPYIRAAETAGRSQQNLNIGGNQQLFYAGESSSAYLTKDNLGARDEEMPCCNKIIGTVQNEFISSGLQVDSAPHVQDASEEIRKSNQIKIREGLRIPEFQIETEPEHLLGASDLTELSNIPHRGVIDESNSMYTRLLRESHEKGLFNINYDNSNFEMDRISAKKADGTKESLMSRGTLNECDNDNISNKILSRNDEMSNEGANDTNTNLDNFVLSLVQKYKNEMGTDTNNEDICPEDFVNKINEYIDNMLAENSDIDKKEIDNEVDTSGCVTSDGDSVEEEFFQRFGDDCNTESKETLQKILLSSGQNFLLKKNANEMFLIKKINDTKDTVSADEVEIYQICAEENDNEMEVITDEDEINKNTIEEMNLITKETAADDSLQTNLQEAGKEMLDLNINKCVDSIKNLVIANEMEVCKQNTEENSNKMNDINNQLVLNESSKLENNLEINCTKNKNIAEKTLQPNIRFLIEKKNGKEIIKMDISEFINNIDDFSSNKMGTNIVSSVKGDKINTAELSFKETFETFKIKKKKYIVLKQYPWESAHLTVYDDAMWKNKMLTGELGSDNIKERTFQNLESNKNVYVIQKDDKVLCKIRREDSVMSEMKTNEVHALKQGEKLREVIISMIVGVELIEKNNTKKLKRMQKIVAVREDGQVKFYKMFSSTNKVQLVEPNSSSVENKKKTKKYSKQNVKKAKKYLNKFKKTKKIQKEAKRRIKRNKSNREVDISTVLKAFFLTAEQDPDNTKRKCKCGKRLPSNAEKSGIHNVVDHLIEEQISTLCFDVHRAAKFGYLKGRSKPRTIDDINNDRKGKENVASKEPPKKTRKPPKKIICPWHEDEHLVTVRKDEKFLVHLTRTISQDVRRVSAVNRARKEITLVDRPQRIPPVIKKSSVFKEVLQESTGQKLRKKKRTLRKKKEVRNPNNEKTISSLEKENVQVEKDVAQQKKRKLTKKSVIERMKSQLMSFEQFQCSLKKKDDRVKSKIQKLQNKIDQDISKTHSKNIKRREKTKESSKSKIQNLQNKMDQPIDKTHSENIIGREKTKEYTESKIQNLQNKMDQDIDKTHSENIKGRGKTKESSESKIQNLQIKMDQDIDKTHSKNIKEREKAKESSKSTIQNLQNKMDQPIDKTRTENIKREKPKESKKRKKHIENIEKQEKEKENKRRKKEPKIDNSNVTKLKNLEIESKSKVIESKVIESESKVSLESLEITKKALEKQVHELLREIAENKAKKLKKQNNKKSKKIEQKARKEISKYEADSSSNSFADEDSYEIVNREDFISDDPSEVTVQEFPVISHGSFSKKRADSKVKNKSNARSKKRKPNPSAEGETTMQTNLIAADWRLLTARQLKLREKQIEQFGEPAEMSIKQREEGMSNILGDPEEIFQDYNANKSLYDEGKAKKPSGFRGRGRGRGRGRPPKNPGPPKKRGRPPKQTTQNEKY